MRKKSSQSKSVAAVKRSTMMVCPHCGHEDFERKEGFSLFGQKFVCAKCNGTFKKANLVRAKTANVQVDKQSQAHKSAGKGHQPKR